MQETIRYKKLLTAIENTRTLITWEIQIILFTRKWKITIKYSYLTPKKFSNTVFCKFTVDYRILTFFLSILTQICFSYNMDEWAHK